MMKNYKVTINGKTYDVGVEDAGGGVEVKSVQAAPAAAAPAAPKAAPAPAPAPAELERRRSLLSGGQDHDSAVRLALAPTAERRDLRTFERLPPPDQRGGSRASGFPGGGTTVRLRHPMGDESERRRNAPMRLRSDDGAAESTQASP